MKKAVCVGVGLGLIVILAGPLLLRGSDEFPSEKDEDGQSFMTPDYAQRLGLREVSQETFHSCPMNRTYEEVGQWLGVKGRQLQEKDDLPPIPFEFLRNTWRKAIDHPEKEVYAWVSPDGEVMTITFRNGESVHIYSGQGSSSDQ